MTRVRTLVGMMAAVAGLVLTASLALHLYIALIVWIAPC